MSILTNFGLQNLSAIMDYKLLLTLLLQIVYAQTELDLSAFQYMINSMTKNTPLIIHLCRFGG